MAAACPGGPGRHYMNLMPAYCDYWFAAAVKPRHEKSAQRILEYRGFQTSLPLQKCRHTRRCGSKWESEKPLIPGYVFVGDDPQNPCRVLATPGVVQIVGYRSGSSAIPASQVEALERIAASQLRAAECNYIRVGQVVNLVGGPLRGVQGMVLREAGATRFVVSLELLQRSVAVEIESDWAIPVQYQYAS
jgi:transcriptional antiterminator NusG